jgi:DNA modification methylase
MENELNTQIHIGDCLDVLKIYPDNTFDLIVTSPAYADSRKKLTVESHPINTSNGFYHEASNFSEY